jgi:hypothetical protein
VKEGSNERQGKGVPGATHTTKERRCSLFQGVICDDREFFQKFRERRSRVISSPPFRFAAPGLSSATTIRPEEAHLTTALAFLWYFCYFTTVLIVRNRHAVVYAPKATRKCTKKPRRKSKTTRFPEGHRLVQTEFKPRASSTRVTGTGSANSGSRICS